MNAITVHSHTLGSIKSKYCSSDGATKARYFCPCYISHFTYSQSHRPMMGKITREDRIVIKALQVEKNWSCRRVLKEFASKAWCRSSLD